MKKLISICLLSPMIALAQKEIKPSVTKAETALQKGMFDEAKAIIDVTVNNQEFMVDKKGNPSKNAAKAWYLKGLIYAGIDTTKVEKFKSLDPDPFAVVKQSLEKCNCEYASYILTPGLTKDEVKKHFGDPNKINAEQWVYNGAFVSFKEDKVNSYQDNGKPIEPKSESYVNKLLLGQPLPMTNHEVAKTFAQKYLERGYDAYKNKDYKKALVDVEKVTFFLPNDTTQLMNVGVYFAPQAGEDDKAISYINKYIAAGGKNTDAYIQMYTIYMKRKDTESALKVAKELSAKYPNNVDFLNMEYNIYAQNNRLPEAKVLMQKRAAADPKDKESRYFLGLISNELKETAETMKWMQEALKVDPDYYDANLVVAKLIYTEAQNMRKERNAISGSKPADLAKRKDLYQKIPVKLKESEVYWKKCLETKPNEEEALYGIFSLYNDISTYDEKYEAMITELKKKMKSLGLEVD